MALGRKVLQPIKLVLRSDAAIDWAATNYEKYLETWDLLHVKFLAGVSPTVFHVKQLTHLQRLVIADQSKALAQELRFRCGVTRIENYEVEDPYGAISLLSEIEYESAGQLGQIVAQKWMSEANLPEAHVREVAETVGAISELSPFVRKLSQPLADAQASSGRVPVKSVGG